MKFKSIGNGSIARKHMEILKSLNPKISFEIIDSRSEKEQISQTDFYDAVLICSPTYLHTKHILDNLHLSNNLFIEKPVSHTVPNFTRKQIKCLQNINTLMGCNLRYLQIIQKLKEFLESGVIGKIWSAHFECLSYLPEWRSGNFKESYSANSNKGGGVHLDLIHEIDLAYFLFGMPCKVMSSLENWGELEINSFETASYHLLYHDKMTVNINLSYLSKTNKRELKLLGTKGQIKANLLTGQLELNDTLIEVFNETINDTYVSQWTTFLNIITKKQKSNNTIFDGIKVLKVCNGEI